MGIREEEMSQDLQCIANPSSWVMATWGLTILFFSVYLKDSTIKQTKNNYVALQIFFSMMIDS